MSFAVPLSHWWQRWNVYETCENATRPDNAASDESKEYLPHLEAALKKAV
jgi:hypothetical protein